MRNVLIAIGIAPLVFGALILAGLPAVRFLMPDAPNIYRTAAYDITLPKGWSSQIQGTETLCNPAGPPPYPARLIATMKYRDTKRDTLDAYAAHLEQPQTLALKDGKTMASTVEHIERKMIDGRAWVDATHLNSEVLNYRTQYLATVTAQIGILITFSSHKNYFKAYQPLLEESVRSIKVYQRYDETTQ